MNIYLWFEDVNDLIAGEETTLENARAAASECLSDWSASLQLSKPAEPIDGDTEFFYRLETRGTFDDLDGEFMMMSEDISGLGLGGAMSVFDFKTLRKQRYEDGDWDTGSFSDDSDYKDFVERVRAKFKVPQ